MVSKELVGNRIRQVRTVQRKTLKDVEAASGFSSTHISEIERGRTSPTIGALIRIAHALDKDPSFFIEERELEEVCVTNREKRSRATVGIDFKGSGFRVAGLTRGILGGRLLAWEILLDPQAEAEITQLPETGDLSLVGLEGECQITLSGQTMAFEEKDSLHLAVEDAKVTLHGGKFRASRILMLMDPRETIY